MIAKQLLSENLYALRSSDSVSAAREFMLDQGVTELPILDKNGLYNYARVSVLQDLDENKKLEAVIPYNPIATFVFENQHLYEITPILNAADMQIIAVLNEAKEFVGIIHHKKILQQVSNSLTYKGIGAVLVIKSRHVDFAPSHLARMIEENGAKMMGMVVNEGENNEIFIQVKLNTPRVKGIVQYLQRFNYSVENTYMAEDMNLDDTAEFNSVLKFFDL